MSIIQKIYNSNKPQDSFEYITTGVVVSTNDPLQEFRIQAVCVRLGDSFDTDKREEIPWCAPVMPFAGAVSNTDMTRGADANKTSGIMSYGFGGVPKIGATVIVACLDGDPNVRYYLGCILPPNLANTLPHGRHIHNSSFLDPGLDGVPEGPLTTDEEKIQPLYDNLTSAFTNKSSGVEARNSFEWRTRGADYQALAVTQETIISSESFSSFVDDELNITIDGRNIRQGYAESRTQPGVKDEDTGIILDPQLYFWTTPGFHSISMDDRVENCRLRIRTTSGHQIIMDDTNERIYISAAEGKAWMEIDQDGHIDIYSENKFSIHSADDINFTSDKSIRMFGKEGIHMHSDGETRITTGKIHLNASGDALFSSGSLSFKTGNIDIDASNYKTNAFEFHLTVTKMNVSASTEINLTGNSKIGMTGGMIDLNGGPASPAKSASAKNPEAAKYTNRVPNHEPWGRMDTKNDSTHEQEYSYNDSKVGKGTKQRGPYWRR